MCMAPIKVVVGVYYALEGRVYTIMHTPYISPKFSVFCIGPAALQQQQQQQNMDPCKIFLGQLNFALPAKDLDSSLNPKP